MAWYRLHPVRGVITLQHVHQSTPPPFYQAARRYTQAIGCPCHMALSLFLLTYDPCSQLVIPMIVRLCVHQVLG